MNETTNYTYKQLIEMDHEEVVDILAHCTIHNNRLRIDNENLKLQLKNMKLERKFSELKLKREDNDEALSSEEYEYGESSSEDYSFDDVVRLGLEAKEEANQMMALHPLFNNQKKF